MTEEQRRKTRQINFRLPPELAERFEAHCESNDIAMTQFFENAVRRALGEPLTIPQEFLGLDSHRLATREGREWGEKIKEIEVRLTRLEHSPAPRMESEKPHALMLPPGVASVPIEELQLPQRTYNALKRAQFNTVSDLFEYSEESLLEVKNLGAKSIEEVAEAFTRRTGFKLSKTDGEQRQRDAANSLCDLSPEEQREQLRAEEREGKSERAA